MYLRTAYARLLVTFPLGTPRGLKKDAFLGSILFHGLDGCACGTWDVHGQWKHWVTTEPAKESIHLRGPSVAVSAENHGSREKKTSEPDQKRRETEPKRNFVVRFTAMTDFQYASSYR